MPPPEATAYHIVTAYIDHAGHSFGLLSVTQNNRLLRYGCCVVQGQGRTVDCYSHSPAQVQGHTDKKTSLAPLQLPNRAIRCVQSSVFILVPVLQ